MSERKKRRRPGNKPQSEVGYGRPPVDQQFGSPNRTGRVNTAGRPKKSKASPSFDDALNEKVAVNENGRKLMLSRREVMYKQLARKASEGNTPVARLVFEHDARLKEDDLSADPFEFDPKLLKKMLKKHDEETADRARRTSGEKKDGAGDDER